MPKKLDNYRILRLIYLSHSNDHSLKLQKAAIQDRLENSRPYQN